VPVKTAYNQFTQFEEWPKFMHRVTSVSQEDETHVSFKSKIWGVSKEFQAEIDEQRPDERIKWHVTQGLSHKGVATFHELAPRLTRIEVSVDVEPGSLIEKFARGARHVKRAMRADLHRYKAYIMMIEQESGEWRGTIEDAEVKSSEKSASSSVKKSASSSEKSASSGGGSRARRSGSKSGEAKAASSSSGRSRSSSGSSKRSSSGSSKRSSSGSSKRSSSGSSSKRSSSNGSSKRSGSSNGGDPSSRSSSGSSRRKSSSRS
jgi:hypothetical protein